MNLIDSDKKYQVFEVIDRLHSKLNADSELILTEERQTEICEALGITRFMLIHFLEEYTADPKNKYKLSLVYHVIGPKGPRLE